jgi:hypothetical protein
MPSLTHLEPHPEPGEVVEPRSDRGFEIFAALVADDGTGRELLCGEHHEVSPNFIERHGQGEDIARSAKLSLTEQSPGGSSLISCSGETFGCSVTPSG